jgi:2-polyprenyl-3-methyl-5-hydroxy-6-metoxy-1,4-benzoquinol methylase
MSLDYSLHYEYWHPDTVEHVTAMRRYFAAEVAPALPIERTGRALDIGCGFGYAMLALGDLGFARVEGVEASEQQAARARKYGLSVSVTADTVAWLSGRPDTFAVVLLLDVLEHFPREQQIPLLAAIHRSLIPGGRVIVQDPECKLDRSVPLALYRLHSSHELHRALALLRA